MEIRLLCEATIILIIITLWTNQIYCLDYLNTVSDNNRIEVREHITKELNSGVTFKSKSKEDKVREIKKDEADVPHSRKKRLIWITNDGRLALPPGTSVVITPTLSMPFIRHPLEGFFSNLSISIPVTVDFDKLGLTDNENPYGDISPLFGRSYGRSFGEMAADFVGRFVTKRRGKRNVGDMPKDFQQKAMDILHGGERAILFSGVEDLLYNFGLEGKACLLRAICEVHAHPLTNFGLFGEVAKLLLTASKSPYSHLLEEYVEAEKAGTGGKDGPGECWPYYKKCSKSLFIPKKNKYTEDAQEKHHEDDFSNSDDELYNNVDDMHE